MTWMADTGLRDTGGGKPPLVRLANVTKRFGAVVANEDVSFELCHGRVIALLGENGAGKSTIMNVLAGLYLPDEGRIEVDGQLFQSGSPRASIALGIGMVHQQFRLVDTLTGFENISLAIHAGRFLQRQRMENRLIDLMAELGFDLDLTIPVWQLSLARKQQLEILRTLAAGARLLILDEPTSVLSPFETAGLFGIIRKIAASQRSVVLISHKLSEILAVADDLVIMRAGRIVHQGRAAGSQPNELARLIMGEQKLANGQKSATERRPKITKGPAILRVHDVTIDGEHGRAAVREARFEVAGGELVAIVGVTGNGQTELMEAIGGLRPTVLGRIEAPHEKGRRAFAYIPAKHLGTALAPGLSISENAILGHHRKKPFGFWLKRSLVTKMTMNAIGRFGVKASPAERISRLSGGNLQRMVLGRELLDNPSLIVADYPTRGLDLAAAAQIRSALVESARSGAAVIISTEEVEESLDIATRILVMNGGAIVADLAAGEASFEAIGQFMTKGREVR